ncbi:MAG: ABC transporter substrate-binding protein [Bdellovibrionota bacterium]
MKMFLNLFIVLSCLLPFGLKANFKLGYGSSTAVVNSRIQEGFLMGFDLGIRKMLGDKRVRELLTINQVEGASQLGAIQSASELVEKGVVALFGFPGSHDSLLAAKIAQKANVLFVAPGCNHNGLGKVGDTVYTTGHSMDREVSSMLDFLKRFYSKKKGLVIINPSASPSLSQEDIFKQQLQDKSNANLNISIVRLNLDLQLPNEELDKLKKGDYSYICFTAYPEALVSLSNQLKSNSIDLPTVAGSAWGTVDSDVMRRYISTKKSPFYMAAVWVRGRPSSVYFERTFKLRYGRDPTPDNAFGYDLGIVAGSVVKRVAGKVTAATILSAFKKNKCFYNLTVGKLCFGDSGGHSDAKISYLKYTKKGFEPVL